ncbi:MAG: hypothetical protein R8M46_00160 [Ghiorsea sp.]
MYKNMIWVVGLVLSLSVFSLDGKSFSVASVQAEDNGMTQVRLVLKKLRGSLASMKDFDELEEIGMDKADVNRMRRAMKLKIKQMTSDAVDLISAL